MMDHSRKLFSDGPPIHDVSKMFSILTPSPCPHLELIRSTTKFMQPPTLLILLGSPSPSPKWEQTQQTC